MKAVRDFIEKEAIKGGATKITEKLNLYVCEHGCHNVTCDVDDGVTPFYMRCLFTGREDRPLNPAKAKDGQCVGMARSSFYPRALPQGVPYPQPTHEWYRPKRLETLGVVDYFSGLDVLKLSIDEIDHIEQGGLLLRPRTKAPILKHED